MSSVRTLKIRRSGLDEAPVVPDLVLGSVRSDKTAVAPPSAPPPLEFPYDRQCVVRFPADIAAKIGKILSDSSTTDLTEVIQISIDNELVAGHPFRAFSISVLEHQRILRNYDMKGILVDLPTFVESYKTINEGVSVTKSSDVSQMLICFRKADFVPPYNDEIQSALSLLYPSGLTPPTHQIRYRKFRPPPSKEDVQNLRSAEDTIDGAMSGGALEWVVETRVPETEALERALNEPENVWTPTEEILAQLRQAGFHTALIVMSCQHGATSRLVASAYTVPTAFSVSRQEFKNEFQNGQFSPVFGEITCQGGSDLLNHALANTGAMPTLVDLGSGIGRFCLHSAFTHGDRLAAIHGVELSPSRHETACNALCELRKTNELCAKVQFHSMNLLSFPLTASPLIIYCSCLTFSSDVIAAIQARIEAHAPKGTLVYSCREFDPSSTLVHIAEITLETSWSPEAVFHVYNK